MKGEVHDENASRWAARPAMPGCSARSTACSASPARCSTAAALSPRCSPRSARACMAHRTCGWERRFAGWHGGDACSDETIGHTGFTGTGLWIDFERGLAWADSY
jgi:CubicO group peptidase (beta-lactamase class C family)